MPFPFQPSTTSLFSFQAHLQSSTHPSLPTATSHHRSLLRSALKSYKKLPSDLSPLTSSLTLYLRFLSTLDLALSGRTIAGEEVDIALINEIEVSWRSTLSSSTIPGREAERIKSRGLDFEIYFAHHTLAILHTLSARSSLLGLYSSTVPTTDQRTAIIQSATKSLRTTCSIHAYLTYRSTHTSDGPPTFPATAVDISAAVQVALQHLAQAELNLLAVLKDDPYPSILVQSRNKDDKEWMIKAPTIPKVRAQVLRRLCIGAAESANTASACLKGEGKKISKELVEYCDDLQKTSRAKGCRFAALDADVQGETGKGVAWLRAGMSQLGLEVPKEGSKAGGLSKLKSSWNERREDKKIAKGDATWGADGGRAEEARILEYLHTKLVKENDTINIQIIPEWKPLLVDTPSGMSMTVEEKWKVGMLEEDELAGMRAPPETQDAVLDGDSSEEEGETERKTMAGAFPDDHSRGSNYY